MSAIIDNQQLVLKERMGRDMQLWDTLFNSYAPDGTIRISWYQGDARGFTDRSKEMSQSGVIQVSHSLEPPAVWLNDQQTRGAVVFGAKINTRSSITDDSGKEILVDTETHARMFYTTTKEAAGWKIKTFDCAYLKDSMTPALPGQLIVINPDTLAAFRPSYRMLSWGLAKRGHSIDTNLPGEDKPETMLALHRAVFDWIGQDVS